MINKLNIYVHSIINLLFLYINNLVILYVIVFILFFLIIWMFSYNYPLLKNINKEYDLKSLMTNFINFDLKYLFFDLSEIFKNRKHIFIFFLYIVVFNFLMIFYILFFLISFIYFFIYIYYCCFLKINSELSCKEDSLSKNFFYLSIFKNIFIFYPFSQSFFILYKIIDFFKTLKLNKKFNLTFLFFVIIMIIFRVSFLFLFFVSFIVVTNATKLTLFTIEFKTVKAENFKAYLQNYLINFYTLYAGSIVNSNDLKIIIENSSIRLNPNKQIINFNDHALLFNFMWYLNNRNDFSNFFIKFKNSNITPHVCTGFFKNNFFIGNNFTSQEGIYILDKSLNEYIYQRWSIEYKPNLENKNKFQFITNNWTCKNENLIITEIPEKFDQNIAFSKKISIVAFLMNYDNNKFIVENNTIYFENNKFITNNENWFTPKNKEMFDLYKIFFENNKYFLVTVEGRKQFFNFMYFLNKFNIKSVNALKEKIDGYNDNINNFF